MNLLLLVVDYLQVALDVTADGVLPLPPQVESDSPSQIFNITIFLYSYVTGWNFTITNGTTGPYNASIGDIMDQEPGSTVKHVNWVYPECLVGNGEPEGSGSARGLYNVSPLSPQRWEAERERESWGETRGEWTTQAETIADLHPAELPPQQLQLLHHLRPAHRGDQQRAGDDPAAVVRVVEQRPAAAEPDRHLGGEPGGRAVRARRREDGGRQGGAFSCGLEEVCCFSC